MGDIGSPTQHDSHFPLCFKGRNEGSNRGSGEKQKENRKKKKKKKEEERGSRIGSEGEAKKKRFGEGREREENKGFWILMWLSSSARTKVLSWSD